MLIAKGAAMEAHRQATLELEACRAVYNDRLRHWHQTRDRQRPRVGSGTTLRWLDTAVRRAVQEDKNHSQSACKASNWRPWTRHDARRECTPPFGERTLYSAHCIIARNCSMRGSSVCAREFLQAHQGQGPGKAAAAGVGCACKCSAALSRNLSSGYWARQPLFFRLHGCVCLVRRRGFLLGPRGLRRRKAERRIVSINRQPLWLCCLRPAPKSVDTEQTGNIWWRMCCDDATIKRQLCCQRGWHRCRCYIPETAASAPARCFHVRRSSLPASALLPLVPAGCSRRYMPLRSVALAIVLP